MDRTDIDPDVERRLSELEAESDARRRDLSELARHLPAEVSRRDVVRDSLHDLRVHADPVSLARRVAHAVTRASQAMTAGVRARLGR